MPGPKHTARVGELESEERNVGGWILETLYIPVLFDGREVQRIKVMLMTGGDPISVNILRTKTNRVKGNSAP